MMEQFSSSLEAKLNTNSEIAEFNSCARVQARLTEEQHKSYNKYVYHIILYGLYYM